MMESFKIKLRAAEAQMCMYTFYCAHVVVVVCIYRDRCISNKKMLTNSSIDNICGVSHASGGLT